MASNGTRQHNTIIKTKPRVEKNRCLVTGGAGFVGSHLCEFLVERGDHDLEILYGQNKDFYQARIQLARQAKVKISNIKSNGSLCLKILKGVPAKCKKIFLMVICLDNFFTGSKENIAHLIGKPNFEMIRHDVTEKILIEVDQVFHLACPASPIHYKYNPIKTLKTGFIGTMNMLGLAKRCRAKFLITSTSEVYGDPLEHPQRETYWGHVNPIGERACYDEGKRVAETLTMDYHREHGLEVRIVRIFNTYGPRMALDDGRVVSNFVAQAIRGEPLTVYGDGQQTRSFQYINDLVKGIVAVMDNETELGPFNIGNPKEFTMLQLAKLVQQEINPKVQVEFRENTADDPKQRKPDITKAKEKLGWEPVVPLNEGLKLMHEDFLKRVPHN